MLFLEIKKISALILYIMSNKLDLNLFTSDINMSGNQIVILLSFTDSKLKSKLKKHKISFPKNLLDDFQGELKQIVFLLSRNYDCISRSGRLRRVSKRKYGFGI